MKQQLIRKAESQASPRPSQQNLHFRNIQVNLISFRLGGWLAVPSVPLTSCPPLTEQSDCLSPLTSPLCSEPSGHITQGPWTLS